MEPMGHSYIVGESETSQFPSSVFTQEKWNKIYTKEGLVQEVSWQPEIGNTGVHQ